MKRQETYHLESRKQINIDEEKKKILEKKDEIIENYITTYIKSDLDSYYENIAAKKYKDGSRFEGEIKNDKRNGQGIYFYKSGDIFCGEWKNDVFNGKGIYIFDSGERYEGNLVEGMKNGKGFILIFFKYN